MKLLIRGTIFGFMLILGLSYVVGGQVKQQAAVIRYQKQAEVMRVAQEQRSCQQLIRAQMCSKPRNSFDRSLCSQRLMDFHCDRYMDVRNKHNEAHAPDESAS